MFVYEPALLMIGDWPLCPGASSCHSVGIGMLAAGLHGYLLSAMPLLATRLADRGGAFAGRAGC